MSDLSDAAQRLINHGYVTPALLDDIRAALRAESGSVGLDVERLARAMDAADPPISGDEDDEDRAEHRAYAEVVAAEYARLVKDTGETT